MSAHRRSWVAALTITFAITVAAVGTAVVERGDANPIAVSSATPISGTPGNDVMPGTPSDDVIGGGAGDDVIDGAAGDDTIDGGPGNDFLVEGGSGNEHRIDGGPGDDVVDGGAGNDVNLSGGPGQDIIFGGRGDDMVDGGPGNDRIDAGDGADISVRGDQGDDILLGGAGRDALDGGSGDDVLIGGGDGDTLDGSLGDDVCYTDAAVLEFTISCETEVTIGASRASRDLIDELHPGMATGASVLGKLQANRELQRKSVSGTEGPNTLPGTDAAEAFKARGGDDTVSAGGGDDDLDCGAGNDACVGGAGDDNLLGGPGDDALAGDDGNDVIEGGPGADKIVAGAGDDAIFPGDGDELRPAGVAAGAPADKAIDAGPGEDRIYVVGGGTDAVECGDGADVVEADSTDDIAPDCEKEIVRVVFSTSRSVSLPLSAQQVTGDVTIRRPNTKAFVPLAPNAAIPVDSDLDTKGKSQVTMSVDVAGGTQSTRATASISSGTAKILGPSKSYPDALAIRPISRTPQRCGRTVAAAAQAGDKKRKKTTKPKKTAVQKTKVEQAVGPVKTITKDIIAAAKHTSWTTTQTCTGTRVSVTEGVVKVLDRGLGKTSLVSAGKTYFAKRRRR